jgi:hypothetical protein
MRYFVLFLLLAVPALPAEMLEARRAAKDVALTADPASAFWKDAAVHKATKSNLGEDVPGTQTEFRVRWTAGNLYVLFTCPYDELYLLPNPKVKEETNKLWERDVAEIFVGADFEKIHQYKEYQVSPQGEWVDLDIDNQKPLPEGGWLWNSGMKTKARIDKKAKVWYGEFQIPMKSFMAKPAVAGTLLRGNFYRFQGGPPKRRMVAWSPTGRINNHTPAMFGQIKLVD